MKSLLLAKSCFVTWWSCRNFNDFVFVFSNLRSMSFDNPVYKKTTESNGSLDRISIRFGHSHGKCQSLLVSWCLIIGFSNNNITPCYMTSKHGLLNQRNLWQIKFPRCFHSMITKAVSTCEEQVSSLFHKLPFQDSNLCCIVAFCDFFPFLFFPELIPEWSWNSQLLAFQLLSKWQRPENLKRLLQIFFSFLSLLSVWI